MMMHHQRRTRIRGAAAVEFACTAPLLFLIMFAGLEMSRVNLFRHVAANAALEAARAGITPGATSQHCEDVATQMLDIARVKGATVTVNPSPITPLTPAVSVTVEIPMTENALPMSQMVLGTTLSQTITLPREIIEQY